MTGRKPRGERNEPDLRTLSTYELLRAMHDHDARAAAAVAGELETIVAAVDAVAACLGRGGRLVLVGAGTSGRLAGMQAAEVPGTFGLPEGVVVSLATDDEDDVALGRDGVAALGLDQDDAVVGVAASGRTPYTLAAIEAARTSGATTIGIACDHPTPLADLVEIAIHPVIGPEALVGSTRLAAGTAQKMVLDMLTTGAMVRLGYVYRNLMIGVQATNEKLRDRARRIVADLTGLPVEAVGDALAQAGWSVPAAVLMLADGLPVEEAQRRLAAAASPAAALAETLDA